MGASSPRAGSDSTGRPPRRRSLLLSPRATQVGARLMATAAPARLPCAEAVSNPEAPGRHEVEATRRRRRGMSSVRVLVGTRKGAFVLSSDGKRERWKVHGPLFAGWEIFHMKGSPADPDRVYASQTSSWFGQVIQRSDDGGRTFEPVGNQFVYEGVPGTHQWYDE